MEQAKATLAAKQASQVQAEAEFNRQNQLAKQDSPLRRPSTRRAPSATAPSADVQNARPAWGWRRSTSAIPSPRPFDGVVTAHLQDVGALVGYGSPTKLATIVEVKPALCVVLAQRAAGAAH